jgi:hypothetical protein
MEVSIRLCRIWPVASVPRQQWQGLEGLARHDEHERMTSFARRPRRCWTPARRALVSIHFVQEKTPAPHARVVPAVGRPPDPPPPLD